MVIPGVFNPRLFLGCTRDNIILDNTTFFIILLDFMDLDLFYIRIYIYCVGLQNPIFERIGYMVTIGILHKNKRVFLR